MKTIKYAMYLRKSTDSEDRQIQSIEDQKRELDKLKIQFNIDVVKTYQESKSAKKPGREEFDKMISDIKKGEIQGILCWKINRLSRNPVDGGEIQWLLQQGILQSIMTPGREYRTEDNVMMMSVELGMANQFILDLSKDVKRGLYSKAKKGWRPGLAPVGYLNDKFQEKGNKKILTDEKKFPLVRKIWDLALTGNYTVPAIQEIANDKWGLRTTFYKKEGKLSTSHVYRILTNNFYYGEFEYAGKVYQGKHEAMITPEEYDRVQKILGKKGKPRPKHKKLPFNGVIRCGECGCSITADEKIKYVKTEKKTKSYMYHKCTKKKPGVKCNQKPISFPDLEKQIKIELDKITMPHSFFEFATNALNKENLRESKNRNIKIKNQQKAFSECCKKIDNLIKLYISPSNSDRSLLSDSEFKGQKSSLIKEKFSIQLELKRLSEGINDWLELAEKTFKFATYSKVWFERGDYEKKTRILNALGSNFTLKDGKLAITLTKPLKTIENGMNSIKAKYPTLELSTFGLNKRKTASFKAISAILSG